LQVDEVDLSADEKLRVRSASLKRGLDVGAVTLLEHPPAVFALVIPEKE
jgi:hypothetical protein